MAHGHHDPGRASDTHRTIDTNTRGSGVTVLLDYVGSQITGTEMPVAGSTRRVADVWRVALIGLVVVAAGAGLGGDSGLAVPLLLSSALLVALAMVLSALAQRVPTIASGRWAPQRLAESRRVIRQCDPNAAGHTRPRAPSWTVSGSC